VLQIPNFLRHSKGNTSHRWPSFSQWKKLPSVLSGKEKIALPLFLVVFAISLASLLNGLYITNTVIIPSQGGQLVEGIVGSPRFLNPVYADANDVDRDIIQLIFSGLYTYSASGELIEDLAAEPPQVTEGGRVITVSLKENAQWHDGTPFTADDVVFTITTIQDPAYKSPIRANWIGVQVEKVSDYKVRFHLLDPYAPFFERLNIKILPAHIWTDVSSEAFALSSANLDAVGTGPYQVEKIHQGRSGLVDELQLRRHSSYHGTTPYLDSITFRFFKDESEMLREVNRGTVQSFSLAQVEDIARMKNPAFEKYSFPLPRYFALFFNLASPENQELLENDTVREALSLITDKNAIIQNVLGDQARPVHSPFLPDVFDLQQPQVPSLDAETALALLAQEGYIKEDGVIGKPQLTGEALQRDLIKGDSGEDVSRLQQCLAQDPDVYPEGIVNGNFGSLTNKAVIAFQEKYVKEVLAPIGLTAGTGKAGPLTREKLNALCFAGTGEMIPLSITITTGDQSPLKEVAEAIKQQWETFGITVQVQTFSSGELERDIIKPRAYQTLLFGEVLGRVPDPFPFWHSSQVKDPGLNLASYENKQIDNLLETARKELDNDERKQLFQQAQDILLEDIPALFLYDLDYVYFVSKEIKGVETSIIADPSQRFTGVGQWYAETKRTKK